MQNLDPGARASRLRKATMAQKATMANECTENK